MRGIVQGVGFRPFVFRLAHELKLIGWVRNDGDGVEIEAQGRPADLDALQARIVGEAPPRASISGMEREAEAPSDDLSGFFIRESGRGRVTTGIGPDTAVCPDCLAELFNPADRRWRYPFINCTHCGPRYTLTRNLPWDRASTSMAGFALCPACAAEYASPADRRFHAEPNACPACGPALALHDADGLPVASNDPVADTVRRLLAGEIVAVRGLGGFHLMCDATNAQTVARLRARKSREAKPFALMVAGLVSARRWARLTQDEEALLASPERPVVLAYKRPQTDELAPGLAPGLEAVGMMLPATPLQYLLFHEYAGRPAGTAWLADRHELSLVCTSANPGGEPLVIANDEALRRLAGIADAFLMHNRDILARCDDSVLRVLPGHHLQPPTPQFIRRARGYTPSAIRLARAGEPVLACGAHLKNTVCLTRGSEAFLSPHIGDLDNPATCEAMEEVIAHMLRILAVEPVAIAHDLHPDYHATRLAGMLASELGVPAIAVQHHHAHIAAVLAEHRHLDPALGLALDGVGLGTDGHAWGGELLLVDGPVFERLGHLGELALPGGDRAAREPWRMGAAALHALGDNAAIATRYAGQPGAETIAAMLARGLNCPTTSSLGRWFDAAA
ncbi:MAG: carbamoyltransferase HypF, partial [Zoogloea sp.]|nr:carbamoyltransferase HypF [Zoogloea sp.]